MGCEDMFNNIILEIKHYQDHVYDTLPPRFIISRSQAIYNAERDGKIEAAREILEKLEEYKRGLIVNCQITEWNSRPNTRKLLEIDRI